MSTGTFVIFEMWVIGLGGDQFEQDETRNRKNVHVMRGCLGCKMICRSAQSDCNVVDLKHALFLCVSVLLELMQTEMHHLQTLCIMAEVFRRGMREEVQLDAGAVGRVFPCLDELLLLHHDLFNSMRERRHSSAQPYGNRNYVIERIGDVLLQQVHC